ncbi:hypothetical protein [Parasitella parasitica]|uniref:Uncharacterized protein n=1 Tax=Parasitella parasitica TaxID=35722 RepID=A0A0B7NPQ3_9FUNG|nr:hypothetical protein [Parasitella parasitica]
MTASASLNLIKMEPNNFMGIDIKAFDKEKILEAFQSTRNSYRRTKTISFPPSLIPSNQCIPTMASCEQIEAYESQFINKLNGYLACQSIGDLLRIFSYSDRQIPIGKMSFLGSFFKKIQGLNINLDVAILCNDVQSQNHLVSILKAINLNCDHLTSHPVKRDTFGVIVKIRKAEKPVTAIKKATSVDLVMVYDSAINVYNRVLNQFSGVNYDDPQVVYISTLDSGDIRCYSSTAHEELNWSTLYKNVDDNQRIFHQVNRHANLQSFLVWNDYVASEAAEWAAKKDNTPYIFYQPAKKSLALEAYRLWNGGHPLSKSPKKPPLTGPTNSKKAVSPTNTSTAISSAPTKGRQRRHKKQVQGCATSSKASTSSNAGAVDSHFSTSPARLTTKHTSEAFTSKLASNVIVNVEASGSTTCSADNGSISCSTGQKRSLKTEENMDVKKARSDRFLPAFDFGSILDQAVQQFEEQLNNINIKL